MDAGDPEALKACWTLLDTHREALSARVYDLAKQIPALEPIFQSLTPELRAQQEEAGRAVQKKAMLEGDWGPYEAHLRASGIGYARMGIAFSTWLPLFASTRAVMRPLLATQKDSKAADGLDFLLTRALGLLGDAYLAAKEEIIAQQQEAIRELSTPVLQLRDGMLLLPIVGVVDTDRARKLTASMLEAIRAERARAVVMDITGVPIVDSKVANHLVQACEAARLMGARVFITGISADIAQALVGIGAVLQGVQTVGDLRGGLERAEQFLGYQVSRA